MPNPKQPKRDAPLYRKDGTPRVQTFKPRPRSKNRKAAKALGMQAEWKPTPNTPFRPGEIRYVPEAHYGHWILELRAILCDRSYDGPEELTLISGSSVPVVTVPTKGAVVIYSPSGWNHPEPTKSGLRKEI